MYEYIFHYMTPNNYARTHWKHIQLQFLSIVAKINSFGGFADNTGHALVQRRGSAKLNFIYILLSTINDLIEVHCVLASTFYFPIFSRA